MFAPAYLVDLYSSQAVKFSAAITRCNRVHIQFITVRASMMDDIFSLPNTDTPSAFSFHCIVHICCVPVFPGHYSNFLESHFVFLKSHLAFQKVLVFKFYIKLKQNCPVDRDRQRVSMVLLQLTRMLTQKKIFDPTVLQDTFGLESNVHTYSSIITSAHASILEKWPPKNACITGEPI